jgi:hypothetical protein
MQTHPAFGGDLAFFCGVDSLLPAAKSIYQVLFLFKIDQKVHTVLVIG